MKNWETYLQKYWFKNIKIKLIYTYGSISNMDGLIEDLTKNNLIFFKYALIISVVI